MHVIPRLRFPICLRLTGGVALIAALLVLPGCGQPEEAPADESASAAAAEGEVALETAAAQASYGMGYNVGQSLAARGGLELDADALTAGILDAMEGADPRLDSATVQAAFEEIQSRASAGNREEAEAFLAENARREAVQVTESGLQYEILEAGEGPSPTPGDRVRVHYHGTLPDGTVFDSSVERGQPATFGVTQVIPGWVEALQMMSVGGKWRLYIPPELAYGERGQGQIPPNSALIFEVELLGIE